MDKTIDTTTLNDLVEQYTLLKERIDTLSATQTDVKKSLKGLIEEFGSEDDRGHIVIDLPQEVSGVRRVMQQRRVSKSLDEDTAEEILQEKGIADRCIKLVPMLDEEEIMKAYYEGLLTEYDIDMMFPSKISYALVLTK